MSDAEKAVFAKLSKSKHVAFKEQRRSELLGNPGEHAGNFSRGQSSQGQNNETHSLLYQTLPYDGVGESLHLQELLGHGTYGEVYKALDIIASQHFAVKMCSPKGTTQDIACEFEIMSSLRHPNVLLVYSLFGGLGKLGMLMELGTSNLRSYLKEKMLKRDSLQPKMLLARAQVALQVTNALSYCHGCGVFHLDIKPANVIMRVDTSSVAGKLADFGLAMRFHRDKAMVSVYGDSVYTPPFRPPELLSASTSKARIFKGILRLNSTSCVAHVFLLFSF